MWLAFLKQNKDSGCSTASLELLASSGLVRRSGGDMNALNADGEPVLVQAGADGWSAAHIAAAGSAGADVDATNALGCNGAWSAARFDPLLHAALQFCNSYSGTGIQFRCQR
jgi:hypothetical protein